MSKAAELASLIGNINAGGGGVNRNLLINGAMTVAQRATSVASLADTSGYKTCDRWFFNVYSGTFTQSQSSDSPDGFANSIKLDCTAAETPGGADQTALYQHMEGQNLQAIKKGTAEAKPLVASFWVKSTVTGTAVCELVDNDSAHRTNSQSYTINQADTWEYKTVTFPPDTSGSTIDNDNASSMYFAFWLVAGANYKSGSLQTSWGAINNGNRAVGQTINIGSSTDNNFYLTGVQLEIGQNPTEFEHEPYERTLAKCYRYTQRLPHFDNTAGSGYAAICTVGRNDSTVQNASAAMLPVPFREDPAIESQSGSFRVHHANTGTALSASIATDDNIATSGMIHLLATVSSGLTAGDGGQLQQNNDVDAHLIIEAEL